MTSDPRTPSTTGTTPEPVPPFATPPQADNGEDPHAPQQHAGPTGSRIEQLEHAVADGARSAAQNVDSYVHVYPWGAIAASAALGLVLGLLVGRA